MNKIILLWLLSIISIPAIAQIETGSTPIEIEANQTLEWDQKAQTYTARGNVVVTQGTAKIMADRVTAHYVEKNGRNEMVRLMADGHVKITDEGNILHSAQAQYDLITQNFVATGGALSFETPDMIITAKKEITFDRASNIATAKENVILSHEGDKIYADQMTAHFAADTEGKLSLHKADAVGAFKIKTPSEIITAQKGIYNAIKETADITNNVVIVRGENQLKGDRASVDFKSGVSKLYNNKSQSSPTRVRGVFYPGGLKEKAE